MKLKELLLEITGDETSNNSDIKLYHRISNKTDLELTDFIKNVINK